MSHALILGMAPGFVIVLVILALLLVSWIIGLIGSLFGRSPESKSEAREFRRSASSGCASLIGSLLLAAVVLGGAAVAAIETEQPAFLLLALLLPIFWLISGPPKR